MRVKPALGLLGATALWTAAMVATTPAEAAPAAPQPVVAAYVTPDAQLDPSNVQDWRTGTAAIGNATTYAADEIMFHTTDAVYSLDVVQASIGQPDGDA